MAVLFPLPTDEEYRAWFDARPPAIQVMIRRWPPNRLYLMDSGRRATIAAYQERGDGTYTVMMDVTGEYNQIAFARRVFGVDPETLVECDLPEPGEPLGVLLKTKEEIDAYVAQMRREQQ